MDSSIPSTVTWKNMPKLLKWTLVADRTYQKKKICNEYSKNPIYLKWGSQYLRRKLFPNLEEPIFIIGSPRSGTTFLGDCLSSLPEISYHFEPIITKRSARHIYEGEWSFWRAKFTYQLVYRWLMRLTLKGYRFCEKTPRNCLIMDFLSKAFPYSRFIHIVRDGRDCALSHSKKPWFQAAMRDSGKREPGGYLYGPCARFWVEPERKREFESTSDIHRCVWCWRIYNEHALLAAEKISKDRYIMIRYENLVAYPQQEGVKILNFLNILSPPAQKKFFQALGNAHSDSVGRWKYSLSNEDLRQIEKEAGSLLKII